MQLSVISVLAVAGMATCAILPRADDKRPCDCPTLGPPGTCVIGYARQLPADAPNSAFCGTDTFSYSCDGTYNEPNCNVCAQSVLGNMQQPGRTKQCEGGKFCSNDNGATFHICDHGEEPFVPAYYTDISYSGSTTAAVITSGDYDLNWLHDTIPKWFTSICYEESCQAAPSSPPSQDLFYAGPGFGLSKGTLTLGVSESQYGSTDERDTMVELATLAVIRAATCEEQTYRDRCSPKQLECDAEKITVCKGPSDVNIQMRKYDSDGEYALHAFIHFQLKWDDHSTPFDCSVLEQPMSVVEQVGDRSSEAKGAAEQAGLILTICEAFTGILDMTGK